MSSNRFVDKDNIEHTEYESEAYQRDMALALAEKQQPKSCLKCSHFKVCTIFRNVHPMMEQMFGMLKEKDRPFNADQIAWLCKYYELQREEENNAEAHSHIST